MDITKYIFVLLTLCSSACFLKSYAQELNCNVEVVIPTIEGTNREVFDDMKEEISEYMNNTRWTDLNFLPNEKINCRLYLTIKEYSGSRMKGDLQVQVSRPVYNSTYTTELLNYKDTRVEFNFREGDRLEKNDNSWSGNLNALLDFYAYLIIALDSDSFSLRGGQAFLDKASAVVLLAQSSGEPGWKIYEDNKNRSSLLGVFTESNTAKIRDFYYNYHRNGLDVLAGNIDKGRGVIADCLIQLSELNSNAPMSIAATVIRDSKLDEMVYLFQNAPDNQKESAYKILSNVYPSDSEIVDRLKRR